SLADPMPLNDQWAFVHDYLKYLDGHYSWADLFSLHNEHRVVTTRIVLFADAILFGMRGLLPVAVAYASMAAMAVISAFVVSSSSTPERFTCFAAALGLVWSSAQWPNFLFAFNLQNIFVHLFALACLVAVWCASRSRFYLWIAVALAADALCVFSLASGVFVIVPALLLALFLRTWRTLVLLALFHSTLVVLYFTGYHLNPDVLPWTVKVGLPPRIGVSLSLDGVYMFYARPRPPIRTGGSLTGRAAQTSTPPCANECLLLALNGRSAMSAQCPVLMAKRTRYAHAEFFRV